MRPRAFRNVPISSDIPIAQELAERAYAPVLRSSLHLSKTFESRWPAFSSTWNRLEPDPYLPNKGTYRLRRYGRFRISHGSPLPSRLSHRPYVQNADINKVAGGIDRQFAPLELANSTSWILSSLIQFDFHIVSTTLGLKDWHVDIHQIRTTTSFGESGHVVPEGIHQDGMAFIATHLVARHAIRGGASKIYSLKEDLLFETTLSSPMDSLYALDDRLLHNVEPIEAHGALNIGYRDALLIGFNPFR